jgi:hypothetical protein
MAVALLFKQTRQLIEQLNLWLARLQSSRAIFHVNIYV